jgi:hypothetical protein
MEDTTMTPQRPDGAPKLDALDFELTDFDEARQALDELPPGVGTVRTLEPGYWESRRRKPEVTDRALTGATIDWVLALPPDLRPKVLCERFPRVANALAAAWPDRGDRRAALERLANDDRGQRAGFPHPVRVEIETLYAAVLAGTL